MKTPTQLTVAFQTQPAEPIPGLRRILEGLDSVLFLRAILALLLWVMLISVVSIVYEIWRLENNWRLRIPA